MGHTQQEKNLNSALTAVLLKIERTGRESALDMLDRYNNLQKSMDMIIEEKYLPLWAEAEYIRATLRTYKSRGLITEEEMPKKGKNILYMINYLSIERKN